MIDAIYLALEGRFGLSETPLRLVHFTTTRMVLAFLTSFLLVYALSPRVIALLYRRNIRDTSRDVLGKNYAASKSGTPTMGGLIIIIALASSSLLWCNPNRRPVSLLLMALVFYGGIGLVDDLLKVRNRGSDSGLSRRGKLVLQALFAALFAALILSDGTSPFTPEVRSSLFLPGVPTAVIAPPDLGLFYFPFVVLAFLGIANAINFADGLDGLAILPSCLVALVFGVFAYMFSHAGFAKTVDFPHLVWMNEVTVFSAAFLGAGLGFLWFNAYPAQIFMGDTGSMAIGGTLAAMAILTKTELLFLIVGGVFVFEFLSVFIQDYIGIKRVGRRLFLRAPAHHGYQYRGVSETKVVLRFWVVSFVLALVSIATLKFR